MSGDTNAAKIKERTGIIRDWWSTNRNQFALQDLLHGVQSADVAALDAWIDMHAKLAMVQEGALLADDQVWEQIWAQLAYPPLWLIENWHSSNVNKLSIIQRYYHLLQKNESGDIYLVRATWTSAVIATSKMDVRRWIGTVGGHIEYDPLGLKTPPSQ